MKLGQQIKNKIIKYFAAKPEVAAVYLYGSFARGQAAKDSDIDLAFLVTDSRKYKGFDIPQVVFALELSKISGKKVEVQDLSACRIDFVHRVLSTGKLLHEGNTKKRTEFEEQVVRQYFDLKPAFDEYYEALSEIARKGEVGVRYL